VYSSWKVTSGRHPHSVPLPASDAVITAAVRGVAKARHGGKVG
jgi:hypothetical protein